MRYIQFYGGTPFCGTDYEEYEAYEDTVTDNELDEEADERARMNAESYEDIENDYAIYPDDYDSEEEYENACAEAYDEYYSESGGGWREVSEEEYKEFAED